MKLLQYSIIALLMLFSINAQGQRQNLEIKMYRWLSFKSADFHFAEIEDGRLEKENNGFAHIGLLDRKVPIVSKGGLVYDLNKYLEHKVKGKDSLILRIKELHSSEVMKVFTQIGKSTVKIEVLKDVDGELFTYGEYSSVLDYKNMAISTLHVEYISDALDNCLKEFNVDYKNNKQPEKCIERIFSETEDEGTRINFYDVPPRGVYEDFLSLAYGNGSSMNNADVRKSGSSNKFDRFTLSINNKLEEDFFGFSDGEYYYLNANNYKYIGGYYIRAKSMGRYIYFEDRFSNKGASAAFGLTGSLISNVKRQIVLDTKTGFVFELDQKAMKRILKDYPEINEKYQTTEKTHEVKKMVVRLLNEAEIADDMK